MASTSDCPTDRHSVRQLMRSRAAYLGRQYGHQLRLLRQKLNHVHRNELQDLQERQLCVLLLMRTLLNTPISKLTVENARKLSKALHFLIEEKPLNQDLDPFAGVSPEAGKLHLFIAEIIKIILLAFSHSRCAVLTPEPLFIIGNEIANFGYDILWKLRSKCDPEIAKLAEQAHDWFGSAEMQYRAMIHFCGLITGRIHFENQTLREDLASALIAPVCLEEECPICFENIGETEGFSVLPGCRHSLCLSCARRLYSLDNDTVCPMCRGQSIYWLSNKSLRDCRRYCASLT